LAWVLRTPVLTSLQKRVDPVATARGSDTLDETLE